MKQATCAQWQPSNRRQIPSSYHIIDNKTRITLIQMVVQRRFSIYKAAKILGINQSTSKAIMRKYRQSGHIFMRKSDQQSPQPSKNEKEYNTDRREISTQSKENKLQTIQNQPQLSEYFNYYQRNLLFYQLPSVYDQTSVLFPMSYFSYYCNN